MVLVRKYKEQIGVDPTPKTGKSASKVGGNKKDEKKETRKEGMENYAVVVLTGEITGKGKASKHRGDYYMYKVKIYNNVSYDYYLENKKSLTPSYTHELSRDSWMPSKSRSSKRYGSKNETPPGVYWITYYSKGIGSKKYNIKVSDTKDGDYINGIHGRREGIRIHHYSPHFSEGCITTGNNGKASVMDFIEKIPAIKNNPVILIIEERKVEYKDNIYKGIK